MDQEKLNEIIEKHRLWLIDEGGERANLSYADLRYANLRYANLRYANLSFANLSFANLSYANLSYANLSYADLSSADLSSADLNSADLNSADLSSADLSYANLSFADLSFANLSYADLRFAGLRYATGNMAELRSVFAEKYPITYTWEIMQIGCEKHRISDWWDFEDRRILEMDGKEALKWWRIWKPILQQIIEAAPATKPELSK